MANKTPEDIMREADILIEQTLQGLEATADAYRASGLDPDRLADAAGEKERAEAEALFRKDMEDVEREAAEEAARLSFMNAAPRTGVPRTGVPRRMRNMI